MRRALRQRRPSPALVISIIALFVSIGGIGYAAATIGTNDIKTGAVTAKKLRKGAVTTRKIRNEAVTGAKVDEASLGQVPSAASASNLTAPEAYHEIGTAGAPGFKNGSHNFGQGFSTAAFFRDHEGIVHLKGTVTASIFTEIFTLPAGYRPAQELFVPTVATSAASAVLIKSNGDVEVRGGPGATNNYTLDSITFRAG
jgi:hypothetical protein